MCYPSTTRNGGRTGPGRAAVLLAATVLVATAAAQEIRVNRLPFTDGWHLINANGSIEVDGDSTQIPGHVHTDLLRAGLIKDPYFRFEDDIQDWVRSETWTYTYTFESTIMSAPTTGRYALEFDGIDTVANVTLNGAHIAATYNQHRKYRFDVAASMRDGPNLLTVTLYPATDFAAAAAATYPYDIGDEQFIPQHLAHRAFVRKQQSDFGWDWGPALAPAGIWRPARLVHFGDVLLTNVVSTVSSVGGRWVVSIKAYFVGEGGPGYTLTAAVGGGKASTALGYEPVGDVSGGADGLATLEVSVDPTAVDPWWPAGYGTQPLYPLTVTVTGPSGQVVDSANRTVGFREAKLVEDTVTHPDAPGLTFYLRVNGVPIFAKGSNWIPADAFDNRADTGRLRRLLTSAVLGEQNIIRVWGGGNYMRDDFWALCDELGLMVWLDFMHGGARSPRHASHIAEWAAEVRDNVRRIASHPSLVLYNGNNEGIKSVSSDIHGAPAFPWSKQSPDAQGVAVADYAVLFDDTVRQVVAAEDSTRHFHASCPSNGYLYDDPTQGISIQRFGDPFDTNYGDTRHYDYTSYCLDSALFPRGRFVSEYGWQSYPSLSTLEPVTEPQDRSINSSWADHVQHHPKGNAELLSQNAIFFNPPSSFADFVAQTQAVQALCIGTQSRFYRAQRNTSAGTMGCMYWQLEDIWPAPSWASIESGDSTRWKLLHYHMKRAYAPVMLFADLSGTQITADRKVVVSNASVSIQVISDKLVTIPELKVTWQVWDWTSGTMATTHTASVPVPPLSVVSILDPAKLATLLERRAAVDSVLLVQAEGTAADGSRVSTSTELYLTPFTDMAFPAAPVEVKVSVSSAHNGTVTVSLVAAAMVPMIMLDVEGNQSSGYFGDNGFLALPGRATTVTFTSWSGSLEPRVLLDDLQVRSPARPIVVSKAIATGNP